ncbi:MAG: 3-hydroxybutyryl-CoA dehydrogenase [Solirubrobacteraceae bacterium]|jgi:3-hydroxybutyryl-CoA dehydrogenase|nr:3-hydroxybutyryl-CoA dehydrogenase [Solirubrobacteraceae bacterium]MEA2359772.1 3-hydroxybutyryl-CoA dehydrogenase [Solirubrobacteraceae bacterium]
MAPGDRSTPPATGSDAAGTPGEGMTVAVVGAGFMGSGIAEVVARSAFGVRIYDPVAETVARSRASLQASVDRAVAAGKLTSAQASALLARVSYVDDVEELEGCGLAIEALVEDALVKRDMFRLLDRVIQPGAILGSNTSSIPIAGLAAATGRPDRVLGIHFSAPATVMPVVEVVRAAQTSDSTLERVLQFVADLRMTPIVSKDQAGFILNRMLVPFLVSAVRMLDEGSASREDIDAAMTLGCGHPMGPLELCDFIGVDVVAAVCDSLFEEFKQPQYAAPPLLKRMLASGFLGRKSGRGFYDHREAAAPAAAA